MKNDIPKQDRLTDWSLHAGGAAVIALCVVGFYLLAYRPLVSKGEEDRQRVQQLKVLIKKSKGVHAEHRRLRKELAEIQEVVATTRGRLPGEALEAAFIIDASKIAEQVGLQIVNYKQGRGNAKKSYSETEVRFTCRGSYASVCKFLKQVGELARLAKVSRLDMQSDSNSNSYPFRVTFVLYYGVENFDKELKRGVL